MENRWVAFHVFFHNVSKYDELINLVANQFMDWQYENLIEKWFFIRYWEGGPHIRFRMLNPASKQLEEDLEQLIHNFIENNKSNRPLTKEEFYKNHKFDGVPLDYHQLPWHEEGEVVSYPYSQEIERYGGELVMHLSETIFMHSSQLAVKILEVGKNECLRKLIYSIALTFLSMQEFRKSYGEENMRDYITFYQTLWEGFVEENEMEHRTSTFIEKNWKIIVNMITKLRNSDDIMKDIEEIQSLFEEKASIVKDKKYLDYIVASHIHMTNNRLGVPPVCEYLISKALANIIEEGDSLGIR